MLKELDATEWSHDLTRGAAPTVALFVADWCGYCRRVAPHYRERAQASGDGAAFLMVDVSDEESPLWDAYGIDVVPTLVVFRDGAPVSRAAGPLRGEDVDAALQRAGL